MKPFKELLVLIDCTPDGETALSACVVQQDATGTQNRGQCLLNRFSYGPQPVKSARRVVREVLEPLTAKLRIEILR